LLVAGDVECLVETGFGLLLIVNGLGLAQQQVTLESVALCFPSPFALLFNEKCLGEGLQPDPFRNGVR
jgi:hypothetical protein